MTKTWLHRWAPSLAIAAAIAGAPTPRADDKLPAQPAGAVLSPDGVPVMPMRVQAYQDRSAAAVRAAERNGPPRSMLPASARRGGTVTPPARKSSPGAQPSGGGAVKRAAAALLDLTLAAAPADLYSSPNYANSKLPIASCSISGDPCVSDRDCPGYQDPIVVGIYLYPGGETCTGPVRSGGIKKFVDGLPGLCDASKPNGGKNNLGQCLPLAVPDKTTYPDADYYEIGLTQFPAQFHSDLPATTQVRGYYQKNATGEANVAHYLGPVILATTNRPVRVRFVNELPTGAAGELFIPTDTTIKGAGRGPIGNEDYTHNRATIHLHGGNTPWISDGTQHQWTAPKGEATSYKKGATVGNVPDMWFDASGNPIPACGGLTTCPVPGARNDPGDGALTFYWTNQQSGRFMFYHDHVYGMTRLNVYAGEAAGYLLVNPPDEDALAAATVPGTIGSSPATTDLDHVVPLVIQDKSFVPGPDQLAVQDPTWDTTAWGSEGNFWFPHVYTPNQWPGNPDNSGTNPFGRWDYGPWFWPPQTSLTKDGVNRPLTKQCWSAAAVTATNPSGMTDCPTLPDVSLVPESFFDTMVVNGTAYPTVTVDPVAYRFQILNAANERNLNLSFFQADTSGTEVPMVDAFPHTPTSSPRLCGASDPISPVTGLPSNCWPTTWPVDGRMGGVPDPKMAGPAIVQLGSEGGILPAPAIIPAQPVNYEYNRRNIVVLNVSDKGLFIGPAERADIVVDFSAFAGKTLILYNDAPAPVPAADPRIDYFTGAPDQTLSGGAPTTQPGYGPNTRTVMQVKVRQTALAPRPAFNTAAAAQALAARFKVSQPAPIVPESVFSPVYGTTLQDTYLSIQARELTFTPVCTMTSPSQCPTDPKTPQTLQLAWKAIHELFDTDYGRMNSILGVEVPLTNWLNQTTIPYFSIDPTTEFISDDQPQIWKITHNGVDTHTIHFHLLNAQVLNRVGWDGQITPPDANELGWKESVRMHPLQDIYVALRPVRQNLPWPLPDMWRPIDVTRPLGANTDFTGVDINNNPIPVVNDVANFGWEYVWHCHLLGHEDNDMLRGEVFVVAPEAPSGLTLTSAPGAVPAFAWTDNSKSALTFSLERSTTATFDPGTVATLSVNAPGIGPGSVVATDQTATMGRTYFYRVRAEKVLTTPAIPGVTYPAYSAFSAPLMVQTALQIAPQALDFGNVRVSTPKTLALTVTNPSSAPFTVTGVSITGANAGDFSQTNNCGTVAGNSTCTITVTFTPGALGARSASVVVTNPSSQQSVSLSGTGTAPVGSVAPASLTFNPELVNATTPAQVVTVSNTGNEPLLLSSISFTGTNRTDFAQTNTCGGAAAPAGSCTISVTSRPTAAGARSATLAIATNDPVNPTFNVALSGTSYATIVPATGVTLTASVASPAVVGTAVTFTAQGQGSPFPYQYRFWLDPGTGPVMVQDYGVGATWTMPPTTSVGAYRVIVHVRTSAAVAMDARAELAYSVRPTPPTGVTLTPDKPSPQLVGTSVNFTAAGQGSAYPYQYRFWLDAGTGPVMVQDYGVGSAWTMPSTTAVGSYRVIVHVRTWTGVQFDSRAEVAYMVRFPPATGVTLTSILASPQKKGTAVQFTAVGSGSTGGYQYRFWLDNGTGPVIVQDYSATSTWTMPSTTNVGTYRVIVHVRTAPVVNFEARAEVPYVITP